MTPILSPTLNIPPPDPSYTRTALDKDAPGPYPMAYWSEYDFKAEFRRLERERDAALVRAFKAEAENARLRGLIGETCDAMTKLAGGGT